MPNQNQEVIAFIVDRLKTYLASKEYDYEQLRKLFKLYELFFETASENSELVFSTLFARIAFVTNHYNLPKTLIHTNHQFRIQCKADKPSPDQIKTTIDLGVYVLAQNLKVIYGQELDVEIVNIPSSISKLNEHQFFRIIKGVILKIELQENKLLFADFNNLFNEIWVELNAITYADDNFWQQTKATIRLPIEINLLDVEYDGQVLKPKSIVLDPNFLVNITAVAEGFKPEGKCTELSYLTRKLIPTVTSMPLLKGNIVNFILDELIHDPERQFNDLLPTIFKMFPLVFARMNDLELKKLIQDLRIHYTNLKKVLTEEWQALNINKEKIYLEPSFYSSNYGFQGRLDVFHVDDQRLQIDIIELKSGKVYKPNSYKICSNHYVQTLLYGLLTEKIIERSKKPSLFILYSSESKEGLRFAPTLKSKQFEAIQERNKIILLEKELCQIDASDENGLIKLLNTESLSSKNNFLERDVKMFLDKYRQLDDIEKLYFKSFIRFISNEYQLSKTGEHGQDKTNGLASIWLDSIEEKADNFSIISYLKIIENNSDQAWPILRFAYSSRSNRLSKFRKGDIAVIYPFYGNQEAILDNQIFKCNVIEVNEETITLKLRFQQKNKAYFNRFEFWNVEYDVLDSSFNASFKGLFYFISSPSESRNLLLSRIAPKKPSGKLKINEAELSDEQQGLLNKIINTEDYFLLWGPPGTGKTSFMLKHLVKYLYTDTKENVLLLSFTNRSVDEICAAVNNIDTDFRDFIRLGSRLSVDESFLDQLLVNKIEKVNNRKDLRTIISNTRIFIGTVASASNNDELFKLIKFDTIIIDEASQILEPSLIGLLTRAKRFILIGDHKQLPAVVVQDKKQSEIKIDLLSGSTGLSNMRISLFERLYLQCVKNNWDWAYGVLTKQARMHQQIMNFSSEAFYENKLKILEGIDRLYLPFGESQKPLKNLEFLSTQRLIFIDTPTDKSLYRKINKHESKIVVSLIKNLLELFKKNHIENQSIGVITPFRAQITQIVKDLYEANQDRDKVTIDTVERYQGSARDRIIISLASNDKSMLAAMSNISQEGIDRKLNVALTRAREQIIVLGNRQLLETKAIYKALITKSYVIKADQIR